MVYDQIPYPSGYSIPKFRMFSGEGKDNPIQHLAHFRATCGNTGGDGVLLLRQFSQSLTGVAFEWYCSLEDDSIKTWDEMAEAFLDKFAVVIERVTIADLATLKPNKDELTSNFITRWRNLYIKCDTEVEEEDAVRMILQNIDDWMAPYLQVANINTFQQLVQCVNRLQRKPPSGSQPSRSNRFQKGGRAEAKTITTGGNNGKGKGKGKAKAQNPIEVATTSATRDNPRQPLP